MLSDLQAKIIKEGEEASSVYDEFAEWCEDRSKDLNFEIRTAKGEVAELKSTIGEESAKIDELNGKIEEFAASITAAEKKLKAATEVRATEAADFAAEEADLMETIDVLHRAIAILEREMSLVQTKGTSNLVEALKVVVEASAFSAADASRLTALVQSSSHSADSDGAPGAPDPEAYENHSAGIVGTLEDLLEKAQSQLDDARAKETASLHNFELLELTLKDEIKFATKELGEAKKALAVSEAALAAAEGDLAVTSKSLAAAIAALADLHKECMEKANDYEDETKSRGEELKALATAKKVISEATSGEGGAEDLEYDLQQEGAVSLLQVARAKESSTGFQALRFVRDLARKQRSPALAQLAMRISSLMRNGGSSGDDPFAKVKGLISAMIEKLLAEADAEATEKAFCDKEMAETTAKKEDKEDEIAKLTAKIDSMTARSAELKKEVAELQKQLAELAAAQAEMDKIRQEENAIFEKQKPEMEEGLQGVKLALKVLREYYAKDDKAHDSADGAASGIIGLLEVVESDFTKTITSMIAAEEAAVAEYDAQTKENEILKTTMEQDVKYKTKESTELDEAISEAGSDREGVQAELDAVVEYLGKLKERCIAKPMSYEERVRRRGAEIAGLKEALQILEGEAVLLQEGSTRRLRARSFK
jgi:peptidoglycan hydrolase CwlO-like protein